MYQKSTEQWKGAWCLQCSQRGMVLSLLSGSNSLFSPLAATHSLKVSCKNLVLNQDKNLYLIYLSILITCLLDSGWILKGEVTCESLLGVKGLNLCSERRFLYLQLVVISVDHFMISSGWKNFPHKSITYRHSYPSSTQNVCYSRWQMFVSYSSLFQD